MKKFGLGLTMVIISALPALLMFGHANAGSTYDKDGKVNSPTGKSYKLARKASGNAHKGALTKGQKDTVTSGQQGSWGKTPNCPSCKPVPTVRGGKGSARPEFATKGAATGTETNATGSGGQPGNRKDTVTSPNVVTQRNLSSGGDRPTERRQK